MASWRSGYAEDCKSLYGGSIPSEASITQRLTAAGGDLKAQRSWFELPEPSCAIHRQFEHRAAFNAVGEFDHSIPQCK